MIELIGICSLFIGTGLLAGLLADILDIDVGFIVAPVLYLSSPLMGYSDAFGLKVAIATSLLVVTVTSIRAMLAHIKQGNILLDKIVPLASSAALGAIIGAQVAGIVAVAFIKPLWSLLLVVVAMRLLWAVAPRTITYVLGRFMSSMVGLVVGAVAASVGISGSVLSVPYFRAQGLSHKQALGGAAVLGVFIALAGVMGYMFPAIPVEIVSHNTTDVFLLGYVHTLGAACIMVRVVIAPRIFFSVLFPSVLTPMDLWVL